jgi:hypothetical protein
MSYSDKKLLKTFEKYLNRLSEEKQDVASRKPRPKSQKRDASRST